MNACAIAFGTSASAIITWAFASWAFAIISCSSATAIALLSSAFASATFKSASAWSVWSFAPIFSPTSTSAISIDNISKAVPASRPLSRTNFDILSGFSKTSLCDLADPIDVTIPSPTLAKIVSSPAPPTSCDMFALTVTLALQISWIPSAATAATEGVFITFGLTEIWTASNTSLPARSIAVDCLNVNWILAFSEEISALITWGTFPPAR